MWFSGWIVVGTTLGKYDGAYIGFSYCSSTVEWKFEVSVYGLKFGTNEGNALGLMDGKVLVTVLGAIDRLPLGIYDGREILP